MPDSAEKYTSDKRLLLEAPVMKKKAYNMNNSCQEERANSLLGQLQICSGKPVACTINMLRSQ
jgi:hypothetical protein